MEIMILEGKKKCHFTFHRKPISLLHEKIPQPWTKGALGYALRGWGWGNGDCYTFLTG